MINLDLVPMSIADESIWLISRVRLEGNRNISNSAQNNRGIGVLNVFLVTCSLKDVYRMASVIFCKF